MNVESISKFTGPDAKMWAKVATSKATLEAAQAPATKGHTHVEKLVTLNMATSKTALGESFAHAKAARGAKAAQEFVAMQATWPSPWPRSLR